MTAYSTSPARTPAGSALAAAGSSAALVSALTLVPRLAIRWARRRRDLHHLSQLDDRLLRDIGISRAEIEQAVSRGRA